MQLTKAEAEAALASIQRTNVAARAAFRAHRGHFHLWIWGAIWATMALCAHFRGLAGVQLFPWLSLLGMAASFGVGFLQSSHVRMPVDRRFIGSLTAILSFAAIFPFLLRPAAPTPELIFAYIGLVVCEIYVVAGLWFDTYLLWFGLLIAALILIGFFVFFPIFWLWIAVCTGGAFLLTGFYVRYFWR